MRMVLSNPAVSYTKVITAPVFSESHENAALAALKSKCDTAKTLGIVSVSQHERLVIYDGNLSRPPVQCVQSS